MFCEDFVGSFSTSVVDLICIAVLQL